MDKLFESTAKARLLKLFLMNPEREFMLQEIVKQTQLKRRIIQKEIAKFVRLGLVNTKIIKVHIRKIARATKAAKVTRTAKITKIAKGARVTKAVRRVKKVTKIKKGKQKTKKR